MPFSKLNYAIYFLLIFLAYAVLFCVVLDIYYHYKCYQFMSFSGNNYDLYRFCLYDNSFYYCTND